jgi:hypothetical protein
MMFFREFSISGLKDEICAHVLMACRKSWLEPTKRDNESQHVISSQTQKPSFIPRPKPYTHVPPSNPLKIYKLNQEEIVECQLKGLCYKCDEKYFPGNNCKQQNILMFVFENFSEEYVEAPPMIESLEPTDLNPPSDPPEVELVISLNALIDFSAPQTLK